MAGPCRPGAKGGAGSPVVWSVLMASSCWAPASPWVWLPQSSYCIVSCMHDHSVSQCCQRCRGVYAVLCVRHRGCLHTPQSAACGLSWKGAALCVCVACNYTCAHLSRLLLSMGVVCCREVRGLSAFRQARSPTRRLLSCVCCVCECIDLGSFARAPARVFSGSSKQVSTWPAVLGGCVL